VTASLLGPGREEKGFPKVMLSSKVKAPLGWGPSQSRALALAPTPPRWPAGTISALILISLGAFALCFSFKCFKCQTPDTVKYHKIRLDKGRQQVRGEGKASGSCQHETFAWGQRLGAVWGAAGRSSTPLSPGFLPLKEAPQHASWFVLEAGAGMLKQRAGVRGWSWEKALCWEFITCKTEEGRIGWFR